MKTLKLNSGQLPVACFLVMVIFLVSCNGSTEKFTNCYETYTACADECEENYEHANDNYSNCGSDCEKVREQNKADCQLNFPEEDQAKELKDCNSAAERTYFECRAECGRTLHEAIKTQADCSRACGSGFMDCIRN